MEGRRDGGKGGREGGSKSLVVITNSSRALRIQVVLRLRATSLPSPSLALPQASVEGGYS